MTSKPRYTDTATTCRNMTDPKNETNPTADLIRQVRAWQRYAIARYSECRRQASPELAAILFRQGENARLLAQDAMAILERHRDTLAALIVNHRLCR